MKTIGEFPIAVCAAPFSLGVVTAWGPDISWAKHDPERRVYPNAPVHTR
jgi:hypothetical protein